MIDGNEDLNEVRKAMKSLIHESNSFKANLATTFGQPMAERSREVSLVVETTINPKSCFSQNCSELRPREFYLIFEN